MSYECMSASESFSVSLTLFLSLSIYITEQAYNQTVELAVCSFFNGSLSRILWLIFYHFVYTKKYSWLFIFLARTCFFHALPLFYQSSLSKRHNYNFHFAISEFIFLCVGKYGKFSFLHSFSQHQFIRDVVLIWPVFKKNEGEHVAAMIFPLWYSHRNHFFEQSWFFAKFQHVSRHKRGILLEHWN